jgi:hypothetical protein
MEDWQPFSRRLRRKLSQHEIAQSDSVLRLFYKATPVTAFNHNRIRDIQRSVVAILAENSRPDSCHQYNTTPKSVLGHGWERELLPESIPLRQAGAACGTANVISCVGKRDPRENALAGQPGVL